jgi:hypothetical protein
MAANAVDRRPGKGRLALTITVVSTICALVAFYIGLHAAKTV